MRGEEQLETVPRGCARAHSQCPHTGRIRSCWRRRVGAWLSTLPILSFTGEPVGETYINLKSATTSIARAVVHRAIITDLQNKRRGTASTPTRAEVRGGGKEPYPQKKTGRARRGSQITPLRPCGGVVFGTISTALSSAVQDMVVVEDFGG